MKTLIAIALIALATPAVADEVPASFLGYEQVNQTVKDRLLKPGSGFDIAKILGTPELAQLLGYWNGGLEGAFVNGLPNGTNVLLWSFTLDQMAADLASNCDSTPATGWTAYLHDDFKALLSRLCKWPAPEARDPALLTHLWLWTMSYDAPEAELDAWKAQLLGSEYDQAMPKQAIAEGFFALFMNPYFLLRK
jgi:hypothetical protein